MPLKGSCHVNKSKERTAGSQDPFSQGCQPLILSNPKTSFIVAIEQAMSFAVKGATLEQGWDY